MVFALFLGLINWDRSNNIWIMIKTISFLDGQTADVLQRKRFIIPTIVILPIMITFFPNRWMLQMDAIIRQNPPRQVGEKKIVFHQNEISENFMLISINSTEVLTSRNYYVFQYNGKMCQQKQENQALSIFWRHYGLISMFCPCSTQIFSFVGLWP